MIVVIPAYQPDEKLLNTVKDLREQTDYKIVVVNDGSRESCEPVFAALEAQKDRVTVLRHEVNRGKGAAMKTGFAWIKEHCPDTDGIVTVDADGQHLVKDVKNVCREWAAHPEALVLGSRRFTGNVPLRSRLGNGITRGVFALSTGVKVYDTQTGLRAFGVARVPEMLAMAGERYEYEINQLLYATKEQIPIREVTIDTVYIEDNSSSHFHPVRDAWRIYKMILMFVASSLMAAIIDYALVLLLSPFFSALLWPTLIARVIRSLTNCFVNGKVVFEGMTGKSVLKYYILAVFIYVANLGLLTGLTALHLPLWIAKLLVELVLYPISFYMQRRFVFAKEKK